MRVQYALINLCYRQRDEIVNVQGMIEDTHERWLYMQE